MEWFGPPPCVDFKRREPRLRPEEHLGPTALLRFEAKVSAKAGCRRGQESPEGAARDHRDGRECGALGSCTT